MIFLVVYLAMFWVAATVFLACQNLASKPWLEQGVIGNRAEANARKASATKTGLILFLSSVGSLFGLLATAFVMQAARADWRIPPMPTLLWLNTGMLILSSLALRASVQAARDGDSQSARRSLLTGAAAAAAFLAGQLLAWREVSTDAFFLPSNPANSFFFVMTGLHGLYQAVGLVALARVVVRGEGALVAEPARSAVKLCAIYWHFLLVVWLVIFALLMGWGGDVIAISRGFAGE